MKLKSYLRGLGTGLFIAAVLMGIATSGRKETLSDAEIKSRARELGMVEEDSVLVKPEPASSETSSEQTIEIASDKGEDAATVKTDNKTENKTDSKADSNTDNKTDSNTDDKDAALNEEAASDKNDTDDKKEGSSDDIRDSKEDRAMGGQAQADPVQKPTPEPTPEPTQKPTEESAKEPESTQKVSGLKNSSEELGYNEFFTLQIARGSSSDTVAQLLKKGGAIDNADDFDDFLCKNHYDKKIHPGVFKIPLGADYEQIAAIITGK